MIVSSVATFNGRVGDVSLQPQDIQAAGGALALNPNFEGIATAVTAPVGTNTNQIATTAFVMNAVTSGIAGVGSFNGRVGAVTLQLIDIVDAGGAPVANPALTGTPTAPTAAPGTNTTQIATTAFVASAISGFTPQLPVATPSVLGGVKIGANINVAGDGTISVAAPYALPVATNSVVGGIKVGTGLTVAGDGTLANSNPTPYVLPSATSSTLGGIKVGSGLSVLGDGTLSATAYTLPVASTTVLGGVKQGANVTIAGDGTLSIPDPYALPTASATTLGGIKVGTNLAIDGSGVLSSTYSYTLPIATSSTLGGVKVGNNLSASGDGTLNVVNVVTSFNTRTGDISLTAADVTSVGGALLSGANFTGNVQVTVPTASDYSQLVAPTQWVIDRLSPSVVNITATTVTLTAAQYRATSIVFTGTLTANTVVTFPNTGSWIVYNGTTGGFTLSANTVQVSTPVVIPQTTLQTLATVNGVGAVIYAAVAKPATASALGAVIVPPGSGLSVDGSGNLSAAVLSVAGRTGAVVLSVGDIPGVAALASPAFTGTPTAPTAAPGTNTTQLATTAFVQSAIPAAGTIPYDMPMFLPGVMTNSQLLSRIIFTRAITFPANLTATQCSARVAATASTTLTLNKNGSSIGTLVFAASGTVPTITFSSSVSFAAGDILTITGPATADTTLADISLTIAAFR